MPAPLGEADLEPVGVEVEANKEETDTFDPLYGKLEIDEAIDWGSWPLIFGSLNGEAMANSGGVECRARPKSSQR